MYKIFNVNIKVFSDSYKHHITNNFKQLIEKKEDLKIISIITTLIVIIININIRPIKFLEASRFELMFDTDKKILEK